MTAPILQILRVGDQKLLVPNANPITEDENLEGMAFEMAGTDLRIDDLMRNWRGAPPPSIYDLGLSRTQRAAFQRRSMFLRNRRIVFGYECLDKKLRETISPQDAQKLPPTWLTVGKWTAKAIGDLLDEKVPLPHRNRILRRTIRYPLLKALPGRTVPMGRILVLGNRQIFSEVAGMASSFVGLNFQNDYKKTFPEFLGRYGEKLLDTYKPPPVAEFQVRDFVAFPLRPVARNPLSDSMLRAFYAYYRAIGQSREEQRVWIQVGNLHLAAYEQHVAQLFLDMALTLRPGSTIRGLLKTRDSEPSADDDRDTLLRPLDMLPQRRFLARTVNSSAAAFATKFILAFQVGCATDKAAQIVFAPAYDLDVPDAWASEIHRLRKDDPAAVELMRVWFALDRSLGGSYRTGVRDWRDYPYRMNYIANLFASSQYPSLCCEFASPVFTSAEKKQYLSGCLPASMGIRLNDKQSLAAESYLSSFPKAANCVIP